MRNKVIIVNKNQQDDSESNYESRTSYNQQVEHNDQENQSYLMNLQNRSIVSRDQSEEKKSFIHDPHKNLYSPDHIKVSHYQADDTT